MATQSLIIELDAKTAKLDSKLRSTENRIDNLEGSTKKADSAFNKIGSTSTAVAGSLAKLATVGLAVSSAITAITLSAASNRRELELLSRQAKTSTADFQALSFATQTFGISAEQMGDISKDISDKVSEFSIAGTGAFQDYADTIKLTKEEARAAATEFTTMSSEEVIGKMISEMEKAGVSAYDMTFALESIGSDLSKLQPAFANNSKELKILKDRFDAVNDSLQITDSQAAQLKKVSDSYSLMTSQIGNATTSISATLAPVLDDFFNDVISVVPQATQTIIDFVNSFLAAEDITTKTGIMKEISNSQARLVQLEIDLKEAKEKTIQTGIMDADVSSSKIALTKELIKQEKTRTTELNTQLEVLESQRLKLGNAKKLKGGEIGGLKGGEIGGETGDGSGTGTGDQIQAIADRFKTEGDLLYEKLQRELEVIGENNALILQLEEAYLMDSVLLEVTAEGEKLKAIQDAEKKKADLKEKAAKTELALQSSVAKNAISLTKMILGDSKAAALLSLVIQKGMALSANSVATAAGATAAFAAQQVPGDPTSFARGTVAAASVNSMGAVNAGLIIATGLGQAAGIASSGGSSVSGSSSSSTTDSSQTAFQPETTSLELSNSSESGSSAQTINFGTDSGDDLIDAIANALNKAQIEGRA